ncbi:hypothetical protein Ddc_16399 [Ditylenchus destructor]|nr:hypothetical protein Ddc_16399 [Ditylenchus destructor]
MDGNIPRIPPIPPPRRRLQQVTEEFKQMSSQNTALLITPTELPPIVPVPKPPPTAPITVLSATSQFPLSILLVQSPRFDPEQVGYQSSSCIGWEALLEVPGASPGDQPLYLTENCLPYPLESLLPPRKCSQWEEVALYSSPNNQSGLYPDLSQCEGFESCKSTIHSTNGNDIAAYQSSTERASRNSCQPCASGSKESLEPQNHDECLPVYCPGCLDNRNKNESEAKNINSEKVKRKKVLKVAKYALTGVAAAVTAVKLTADIAKYIP